MAQETNQSQGPLLCTTGCGFYANPRNNGMCSVCYKDFLQRQNGRGGPPDSSSAASSAGESFLSQSQTGSSIPLPATVAHTDTQCGQSSNVTTTSTAPSEEDESSGAAKASPDTDDVIRSRREALSPGMRSTAAAACSSVGPGSSSRGTAGLDGGPSLGECYHTGQRKIEDIAGTRVEADKGEAPSEGSAPTADDGEEKPKAKKNRCFTCRKKVGLTGFNCRCGNVFCGPHRYSDLHGCTFDYRADAAAKIKKENPVVVGEKIQKI
ncbi:hypothetical protein NHX12_006494 [Muraenolepis orangiensis]|uniref:AN1-type zinc finger protein 6 n=1 Tax=Muraenolepis orangiensis TaxID=630683 RepID=A0A9Q0IDU8_9TELE|nr:hypothetical protein NHX12_006494 [Muraenolepis orangiensis]